MNYATFMDFTISEMSDSEKCEGFIEAFRNLTFGC